MCDDHDDDLRETRCDNKGGQQLMEVIYLYFNNISLIIHNFLFQSLKIDLECGWDNATCREAFIVLVFSLVGLVFWM